MSSRLLLALFVVLAAGALGARPASAQGCTLVDCPNQAPAVSVTVSPVSPPTPNVTLTVYASDAEGLAMDTWQLWVNGIEQSSWYGGAMISNPGGANISVSASGALLLVTGVNTIRSRICDVAAPSVCSEQQIAVSVAVPPPLPPAQGTPYFALAQRTDARSLSAGGSTLSYATPTYVTVNTPRGVSLLYSSELAESQTTVEVDAG